MSKRFWIVFVLLFLGVTILGLKLLTNWGRRYVYSGSETKIDNPGLGKKFSRYPDMYSIVDKSNGTERLVTVEEFNNYDRNLYSIVFLPSHSSLDYSVGYFVGWENIDNSDDKYILLNDIDGGLSEYRVVFGSSKESLMGSWRKTSVAVQNVGLSLIFNKPIVSGEMYILSEIGFDKLSKIIKERDVVAVFTRRFGSLRNIVDVDGEYVVEKLILRRASGIKEFKNELK